MSCSKYERKIIIVGKSGNGKSSLCNVLLGRHAFKEEHSFDAVTKECKMERNEGNVSIVDTPGLFDCNKEKCLAIQALEVQKAVKVVCPHPHAFLVVLNSLSRLTEEELSTIDVLRIIFGEQCIEKAIIVLTHVEHTVDETKLAEMIKNSTEMNDLIKQFGGRYVGIDNREPNREHINRINTFVDQVSKAGRKSFDNGYLNVHENILQEAIQRYDSGPVHEQVKRLSEKIKTAVEEKEYNRKFLKVACVGAVCVAAGIACYTESAKAVAKEGAEAVVSAVSNPGIVKGVIEKSINTAAELATSARV